MNERVFTTAAEMERALIDEALGGALVLTATGRLARRIVDRTRRRMIESGRPGWETARVFALRRFIGESYMSLWPSTRMPSPVKSMLLWHEAASAVPRPQGLELSPSLYGQLQQSLDTLLENGIEPGSEGEGPALPVWRRKVAREYLNNLSSSGFALFPEVCRQVASAMESGRIAVPARVVLAGFHRVNPVEELVVRAIGGAGGVTSVRAAVGDPARPEAALYATPEQECRSVCADALDAWNSGERNLGIFFLDADYFPLLGRLFMELADREPLPRNSIRFNIAGGTPLPEHPLYQTAVLPLRLGEGPRPHERLLSLLASPYAAQRPTAALLKEAFWGGDLPARSGEIYRRIGIPELTAIASLGKATVREWFEALETLWTATGFPARAGESDELAWRHIEEAISEIKGEAGGMETDAGGILSWLNASARAYQVAMRTPETAGIQILSLAESRGLAFSRLWVVGAHGRVLPAPGRETAFLTAEEATRLPGSGYKDRWAAAELDVAMLCAGAPVVAWSRAASNGEEAPYLKSPIVRDVGGNPKVLDLWGRPPAAFMRARWLREGLRGVAVPPAPAWSPAPAGVTVPGDLRVTSLETLLACPFRYFSGELLGLSELEAPEEGISHLERGRIVHRVLESFGKACIRSKVSLASVPGRVKKLLNGACAEVLSALPEDEVHRVERERLLGEDGSGLLPAWLEKEIERAGEGWRFAAAEVLFKELEIGKTGLKLRGKIDRVDNRADGAIAVWDYKTGQPPPAAEVLRTKVRPQLPAYLLAVRRGLVDVAVTGSPSLSAGYICMKRERDLKVKPLRIEREDADWERELPDWEADVSARVMAPMAGEFRADPRPAPGFSASSACRHCPFSCLCGYFDAGASEPEGAEGDTYE